MMDEIVVRYYTDYAVKRIEIYPYGSKGISIDIDFTHYDDNAELVELTHGEITFPNASNMALEKVQQFTRCMKLACEVAERKPNEEWPADLVVAFYCITEQRKDNR